METPYIALIILFVITPVIVIYLEGRYSILKKIGAVLICYGVGLIVGNMGILPEGSERYQNLLTDISIPLALPLILFSLDVKSWFKIAPKALLALITGLFSVIITIFLGYWIFKGSIAEIWKVAGMLVGVYTGGTPNMAAMKTALNVSQELYIMTHTYELTLGAIYLVFILSVGQRVFLWFLPPYKETDTPKNESGEINLEEDYESYIGIFNKGIFLPLLGAFGLSLAILGTSYGLSLLFPEEYSTAAIILFITSFGIAFSFVPKIKKNQKNIPAGHVPDSHFLFGSFVNGRH